MEYLPTILKIIESGLASNAEKVHSYTKMLLEKVASEGDEKSAEKISKLLANNISRSSRAVMPADTNMQVFSLPVDKESRLSLADESMHQFIDTEIQLDSYVEKCVEEFISFVDHSALLNESGVGISPSMLIYGPPGCGKTHLAQHISARLGLPLLTARCDSLMSSFLGSTAKNIRSLFDHASNRPCVLFLDEFDSLAKARDDQHEVGELKRIVVGLLQNIDTLPAETILLAATNHEKLLDPAVWRRFSYRLHIQPPSLELREKLFHQYLKEYSPKNTKHLAAVAEGMSGALIRQACEATIRSAIISNEDEVDENRLLGKLAIYLYPDIIQSSATTEEKVSQLKELNPRLFTHRVLSEIFHISTGKITNITSKARLSAI